MSKTILYRAPDISSHQGVVNFKTLKSNGYDCVFLRAGYGKNNVDQKYIVNAEACHNLGIKVGIYWFSYAYNVEMSRNEAKYAIEQAKKYWASCPIASDIEYDTLRYAKTKGINLTKEIITEMEIAFLKEVKDAGYIPIIYLNRDYKNNHMDLDLVIKEIPDVKIWYALYGNVTEKELNMLHMHQFSSSWRLNGISGNVDMNNVYYDLFSHNVEFVNDDICNLNIIEFQKACNADGITLPSGKKLDENGIDDMNTQLVRKNILLKAKGYFFVGSKGTVVMWFQRRCNEILGHSNIVDGKYGKDTRLECMELQRKLNLKVDGIAGYNTLTALLWN